MALTKFTSCLAALAIFFNQGCDLLRATSAPFLFKLCFHAHKLPIPRPKLSRWGSAAAYLSSALCFASLSRSSTVRLTRSAILLFARQSKHDAERREKRARKVLEKATKEQPWQNRSGARFEIQLGSIRCRSPIPASHSQRRSISQRKRCKLKATSCLTPISLRCSQSWA